MRFAAFSDPKTLREMLASASSDIRAAQLLGQWDGPAGLAEVLEDGMKVVDRQLADDAKTGKASGSGMMMPVTVVRTAVTAAGPSVGYNSHAHNFAGMLRMFILFMGVDRAKNLAAAEAATSGRKTGSSTWMSAGLACSLPGRWTSAVAGDPAVVV